MKNQKQNLKQIAIKNDSSLKRMLSDWEEMKLSFLLSC